MRPAWSVILLTTLIGAGQGLFLALYAVQIGAAAGVLPQVPRAFYVAGAALSLALLAAGLFASFFHLGRPERAWRSAAKWRTSWLSREVIVLPAFMGAVILYGAAHSLQADAATSLWVGAAAVVLCLALFVCTVMIYACCIAPQRDRPRVAVVRSAKLGALEKEGDDARNFRFEGAGLGGFTKEGRLRARWRPLSKPASDSKPSLGASGFAGTLRSMANGTGNVVGPSRWRLTRWKRTAGSSSP